MSAPRAALSGMIAVIGLAGTACHAQVADRGVRYPWDGSMNPRVVVGVFDESTSRPMAVYASALSVWCDTLTDATAAGRASALLRALGWTYVPPEDDAVIRRHGDLVEVEIEEGDSWATILFQRQGALVFADRTVYAGSGGQYWPSDPLPPWGWGAGPQPAPPPASTEYWRGQAPPDTVLSQFLGMDVLRVMADGPWSLFAFHRAYEAAAWLPGRWILIGFRPGSCMERRIPEK